MYCLQSAARRRKLELDGTRRRWLLATKKFNNNSKDQKSISVQNFNNPVVVAGVNVWEEPQSNISHPYLKAAADDSLPTFCKSIKARLTATTADTRRAARNSLIVSCSRYGMSWKTGCGWVQLQCHRKASTFFQRNVKKTFPVAKLNIVHTCKAVQDA